MFDQNSRTTVLTQRWRNIRSISRGCGGKGRGG